MSVVLTADASTRPVRELKHDEFPHLQVLRGPRPPLTRSYPQAIPPSRANSEIESGWNTSQGAVRRPRRQTIRPPVFLARDLGNSRPSGEPELPPFHPALRNVLQEVAVAEQCWMLFQPTPGSKHWSTGRFPAEQKPRRQPKIAILR